jgi:hypothetical protein
MLHVVMASNENWVVPASDFERRYFMRDVSDEHLQEEKWFGPIYRQLENGGYGAMLYDLLHFDLGDWHPRKLPKDTGLLDQQKKSLSPLDAWWVELLETGTLAGCDNNAPYRAVSNSYQKSYSVGNFEKLITRDGLYDQARAVEPRLKGRSDHALGNYLAEQGCDNKHRVLRHRGWEFPSLGECREKWMQRFPNWVWRNPGIEEWQPDEDDE